MDRFGKRINKLIKGKEKGKGMLRCWSNTRKSKMPEFILFRFWEEVVDILG